VSEAHSLLDTRFQSFMVLQEHHLLQNPHIITHSVPWCAMVQNPNLKQVTSINNLPTDTF